MIKEIASGAEAVVYETKIFNEKIIIKERISKKYRNSKLDDKIIKTRNKQEATLIKKAKSANVNTPTLFYIGKNTIICEKIDNTNNHSKFLSKIGQDIAKLHNSSIIHGDLNIINILTTKENKVYFIDFGLGYISNKVEDKATDLLVLKKTLKSSKNTKNYWNKILNGYKKQTNNSKIIQNIENIEKRGRYL